MMPRASHLYALLVAAMWLVPPLNATYAQEQHPRRAHASAPADASARLAFVTLALTDTSAIVLRAQALPGRLKPTAARAHGLRIEVVRDGAVVWTGTVPDPLRQRLEYVDETGALAATTVARSEGIVLVRFPEPEARQQVRVFRSEAAEGSAKAGERLVASVEVVL